MYAQFTNTFKLGNFLKSISGDSFIMLLKIVGNVQNLGSETRDL